MTWRDHIKIHPAAELFPLMSKDELKALGEDIKKNGLQEKVGIWTDSDGNRWLLDGRNRLDALELNGLNPITKKGEFIELPDQYVHPLDPYAYVISANVHRRHLTADQKRDLIEAVIKATPEKSDRQIAETTKTSPTTVGRVRAKMKPTVQFGQLKRVGKDGKARKQPAKKQPLQPKPTASSDRSAEGVSEIRPPSKKPTSELPTGSVSAEPPADQATVAETQAQPANPIIAAWRALSVSPDSSPEDMERSRELRREFSYEYGESVIDRFFGRGRRQDDPLRYRAYQICLGIEVDLDLIDRADDEADDASPEIQELRAKYQDLIDQLEQLESEASDLRAEEEEPEEDDAGGAS